MLGLFLQADDPPGRVQFGDAELARVGHLGQHDLSVGPGRAEPIDERVDTANDEIVAKIHHEVIVAEVVAGHEHRVRQAERSLLADIGDIKAEGRPVAHRIPDRGRCFPDHDSDITDPRVPDRL